MIKALNPGPAQNKRRRPRKRSNEKSNASHVIESGSSVSAWVGLGGNLGDPAAALQDALDALGRIFGVELTAVSSVYQSAPVGLSAQPDFLNAVARIDTSLEPGELLEQLLRIETEQGRVRLR